MCGKAHRAKLLADPCDSFSRRWLNIVKRVVEFKFRPFEPPHLVEGQNVDSLHDSQVSRKSRNFGDILRGVRESRNEHEAYPNLFPSVGQPPRKIQNWPNLHTRNPAVEFWLPA